MRRLEDGTLVDLQPVRVQTHPKNQQVEDSILLKSFLTVGEQNLLIRCLDNYIED